ncbi:MAG: hypothetical protein J2P37_03135 [Ktedonobacteraceae bacterium]|nr:hypothetical protein [Ktedonobacteraceae bacterium]
MAQNAPDAYRFYLGRGQHKYISRFGWIFFCGCILCAVVTLLLGIQFWQTYAHEFVLYLKWQDALFCLLNFISIISFGGSILILRFMHALRQGRSGGIVTLEGDTLIVRDLSPENLRSIFWIMNSVFWCFLAVLVGLLPTILFAWTVHIPVVPLAVLATCVALLLSVAGLVASLIAGFFIVVGGIGVASLCRKLGASYRYILSEHTTLRIDNFVLAIIEPGMPEAMLDLNLLNAGDQRQLLSLLYARWQAAEQVWSPSLGDEITLALEEAERGEQCTVLV